LRQRLCGARRTAFTRTLNCERGSRRRASIGVRPDVPVIMITAYGDVDTRRKALEGGAEALLTKPIDFGTLRGEIETRLGRTA
jgi:DNA-binding response OmpR family regulator